jgi:outer membrane lipoprotein carrier protein
MRSAAIAGALALLLVPRPGAAAEPAAEAGADCGSRIAERVQERYDGVRDLRAHFTQESRNAAFGGASREEVTSGSVWFAKPGRMRWEYESPEPSLVVSDGQTLWIYDPVAREAQRLPVDRGFLSAAAIQFLLGSGRLADTFAIRGLECGAERTRLELLPREEATYERIELEVETATGWIRETLVVDLFGNETRVRFTDLVANEGIDADRFRFVAPEGVRVLTLPGEGDS